MTKVFLEAVVAMSLALGTSIRSGADPGGAPGYPMKASKQKIDAILATFQDGEGAWVQGIRAITPNQFYVDLRSLDGRCTRLKFMFPKGAKKAARGP